MDYSSYIMDEGEVIQPSLSWGSYEYEGIPTNSDHFPSDATVYGCPFFNSSSYHQEGLLQAIVPSPCREEEPDFPRSTWNNALETEEVYDGEQQPYHSCGNWPSDCNYVFNGCSEDNYGYLGNGNNNNPENTESSNTSEKQCDNSSFTRRDDEDVENYSAASAYDPWSSFNSWLAYEPENGEETDNAYERVLRDAEVYEGIFGYWPCLSRRQ